MMTMYDITKYRVVKVIHPTLLEPDGEKFYIVEHRKFNLRYWLFGNGLSRMWLPFLVETSWVQGTEYIEALHFETQEKAEEALTTHLNRQDILGGKSVELTVCEPLTVFRDRTKPALEDQP